MGFNRSSGRKRILCVFSRLLGNNTFTNRLVETLERMDSIEPLYLFQEGRDYRDYRIPRLARASSTIESSWMIWKKYRNRLRGRTFEALFFQAHTLLPPFYRLIKALPTAVALDTTPKLSNQLLRQAADSPAARLKATLLGGVTHRLFKGILRHIDLFLPWTGWCARSLVDDYGIPPERISVTYCPYDLSVWRPGRDKNERFTLLFAGNDFRRKGGHFLLDMFERHLKGECIIRIVSNDPSLLEWDLPDGVDLIKGITHERVEELIEIYQTSHLFLFPTRREMLGLVVAEAVATGLPVVANDVGGIGELVRDGFNGYLMPPGSPAEEWAGKIRYLKDHPELLERFGRNSRHLAEEKLSPSRFGNLIRETIHMLERAL